MNSASVVERSVVGSWEAHFSPIEERVPGDVISQLLGFIRQWQKIFPLADTWVGKEYGVPSLFIRLDFVVRDDGEVGVYEIEDRPCGFGFLSKISPFFVRRVGALRQRWPDIRWVASSTRMTDDEPFFGSPLSLAEALTGVHQHLLVRSRPEEVQYHPLEQWSVSTVSKEGDKRYGVELGWWNLVTAAWNADDSEWTLDSPLRGPCVLKPVQGTRANLVKVYYPNPNADKNQSRGVITGNGEIMNKNQLVKLIGRQPNRQMCMQPFIPPMQLSHQPHLNAIYRLMFGYDPNLRDWVVLGGAWTALNRLVVHGTPDTVFGPLVCGK